MAAVSKACGNMFGLLQGHSAETSGKSAQLYQRMGGQPIYICIDERVCNFLMPGSNWSCMYQDMAMSLGSGAPLIIQSTL